MLQVCDCATAAAGQSDVCCSVRSTTTRTSHAAFFSCDCHSHLAAGIFHGLPCVFLSSFWQALGMSDDFGGAGEFGLLVVPLRRCVLLLQL